MYDAHQSMSIPHFIIWLLTRASSLCLFISTYIFFHIDCFGGFKFRFMQKKKWKTKYTYLVLCLPLCAGLQFKEKTWSIHIAICRLFGFWFAQHNCFVSKQIGQTRKWLTFSVYVKTEFKKKKKRHVNPLKMRKMGNVSPFIDTCLWKFNKEKDARLKIERMIFNSIQCNTLPLFSICVCLCLCRSKCIHNFNERKKEKKESINKFTEAHSTHQSIGWDNLWIRF